MTSHSARGPVARLILLAILTGCGGKDAAAPVARLAALTRVAGDQQTGTAGAALPAALTVEALDEDGLPMAGLPVRFTISGGGALSDTIVATGVDGRASTTWMLGPDGDAAQSVRASAGTIGADFAATAMAPRVGQVLFGREGYIEYIAGDLPIIITAPHGGTLEPGEIPDRTGPDVTVVRDVNTEELARTIGNVFATRTGGRPHLIIVRLRRTKIDANREIGEATKGNRVAGRAWIEFHSFIEAARQTVIDEHGTGLYIDLHGHGHAIPRLELGYLLTSTELGQSNAALDAGDYESRSSVRTLSQSSTASFSGILRGPTSLGALFEAAGFAAVPGASMPDPAGAAYFNGGYNTDRYGSRSGGPVSGVQLETHYDGVRNDGPSRERFATAVVTVMSQYLAAHRGPVTVP